MTAPVIANSSKNTRAADCREALREAFVKKFEGYRPRTEAEKTAGTVPDNFSFVQVGRGHAARLSSNPFPEPIAPLIPLRASAYTDIENALVSTFCNGLVRPTASGESAPLVEYYRSNRERVVAGTLAGGAERGDLASLSVTLVCSSTGSDAWTSFLTFSEGTVSIGNETFYFQSVTHPETLAATETVTVTLCPGQVLQTAAAEGAAVTLKSRGAEPMTRKEAAFIGLTAVNWLASYTDEMNYQVKTDPYFAPGFFFAATLLAYLNAILEKLKPVYMAYEPCAPKSNSVRSGYKYLIDWSSGGKEIVYFNQYAGAAAVILFDGEKVPVYRDYLVGSATDSVIVPAGENYHEISGADITGIGSSTLGSAIITARGCIVGGRELLTSYPANDNRPLSGQAKYTRTADYVFTFSCGVTIGSIVSSSVWNATPTGGWTAMGSGTLYVSLGAGPHNNLRRISPSVYDADNGVSDEAVYPITPYIYQGYSDYKYYRYFPSFISAFRAFKKSDGGEWTDCGAVGSGTLPGSSPAISMNAGDIVTIAPVNADCGTSTISCAYFGSGPALSDTGTIIAYQGETRGIRGTAVQLQSLQTFTACACFAPDRWEDFQ